MEDLKRQSDSYNSDSDNSLLTRSQQRLAEVEKGLQAKIKAHTRQEARSLDNFPSNEFFRELLSELESDENFNIYRHLTRTPATEQDSHDLSAHNSVAFYNKMISFINYHLKIDGPKNVFKKQAIEARMEATRNKYTDDLNIIAQQLEHAAQNGSNRQAMIDIAAMQPRLVIKTQSDDRYDLMHGSVAGYRSNIQRYNKFFIYWRSATYSGQELEKPHERLYLNPDINQAVEISHQLAQRFDQESIPISFKIFNRCLETEARINDPIRTEGLTVYSPQSTIDQALEIILDIYKQNHQAFENRQIPILSTPIVEGIGLASDQGFDYLKISFNQHRALILDQAYTLYKAYRQRKPEVKGIGLYKGFVKALCREQNIDVNNLSFPASD